MHSHAQGVPAPTVYAFSSTDLRVILIKNEPWFVAKDVCNALSIVNTQDAVRGLDDDEKDGVGITDSMGRDQVTTVINESGLYSLIFKSRKPEAKKFKRWVTHEVLPAIRKTGSYGTPQWQQPDRAPEVKRAVRDAVDRTGLRVSS